MSAFSGHPLFDTATRMDSPDLSEYPTLNAFLESMPPGARQDWDAVRRFLINYAPSAATYTRFRGELQRFLLFLWLIAGKSLSQADADDINRYLRFLKDPPATWIAPDRPHAFQNKDGVRQPVERWRPFSASGQAKQGTLDAAHRALTILFRELVEQDYLARSPMHQVRRRERKAKASGRPQSETAPRCTDWQWHCIVDTLTAAADRDPYWERHLFTVVTMKALYLRVFELAPRRNDFSGETFTPTMGDFQRQSVDGKRYWTLYVFGKGEKERWITLPKAYLPYLKRYREHRDLSPYPSAGDTTALITHKRSDKSLGKSAIEQLVKEALEMVSDTLLSKGHNEEAADLRQNAGRTHLLRHTGASMDIERGRPIRHVSKDLGHASVAITEQIYVNADARAKYESGFYRAI